MWPMDLLLNDELKHTEESKWSFNDKLTINFIIYTKYIQCSRKSNFQKHMPNTLTWLKLCPTDQPLQTFFTFLMN